MSLSNDTQFVPKTTPITTSWMQPVNDFVYKGRMPNYVVSTGTNLAYTITLPTGSLYSTPTAGDMFVWRSHISNGGPCTLTVVGAVTAGPYSLTNSTGAALSSGQIASGSIVTCVFDGTSFQLTSNVSTSSPTTGSLLIPSFKDSGAVGNGVADDTAAVTTALGSVPVWANPGTYLTTFADNTAIPSGKVIGVGNIKTADGNKQASNFTLVSSHPTSSSNYNSALTYFNGDNSKTNSIMHRITGTNTLGTPGPATGYVFTPEASISNTLFYNSSGFNYNATDSANRTMATGHYNYLQQAGQADMSAYIVRGSVLSQNLFTTSWLTAPALSGYVVDLYATNNYQYLNPIENHITDQGYDVCGVGYQVGMIRTFAGTAQQYNGWVGFIAQSQGTREVDAFYTMQGPSKIGIDFTAASLTSSSSWVNAAIVMKSDQRIYGNGTQPTSPGLFTYNTGLEFFTYMSSDSSWLFAIANSAIFKMQTALITCYAPLSAGLGFRRYFTSISATTYSVSVNDTHILVNAAGVCTITLPSAGGVNTARELTIKTVTGNAVNSASANVYAVSGGALQSTIVSGTAGKWALLVSDGANWVIQNAN